MPAYAVRNRFNGRVGRGHYAGVTLEAAHTRIRRDLPAPDRVETQALYEMDGLAHVKAGVAYPAVLGVAGWNDPRVAVWEPGKFVAAIQHVSSSGRPALLLVNYDNGHFTEEKSVTFRNFANQFAFALWQAGATGFQPEPGKTAAR